MALITTLIDKTDNVELVRDKIAAILAVESAAQVALATTATKPNPLDWKLRVFTERSNPISEWQSAPTDTASMVPIVNVSFETSRADGQAGNVIDSQQITATFNIDCYGYGVAQNDVTAGHLLGDSEAAFAAQRATRLVRNILMSAHYVVLEMRGVVGLRWVQSVTEFQPAIDGRAIQNVVANRMQFDVRLNESSPQVQGVVADVIGVTVNRSETGEIYLLGDYNVD